MNFRKPWVLAIIAFYWFSPITEATLINYSEGDSDLQGRAGLGLHFNLNRPGLHQWNGSLTLSPPYDLGDAFLFTIAPSLQLMSANFSISNVHLRTLNPALAAILIVDPRGEIQFLDTELLSGRIYLTETDNLPLPTGQYTSLVFITGVLITSPAPFRPFSTDWHLSINITNVPNEISEPATFGLLVVGVAGLGFRRHKKTENIDQFNN